MKKNLSDKILNTLKDFDSEWKSVEDFQKFIVNYISLKNSTIDGWYCIKGNGCTDVYYQERGCKHYHIYRFNDFTRAAVFAVSCSQDLRLNINEDQKISINDYEKS